MSIEERTGITVIPREGADDKHRPYTVVGTSIADACVVWVWAVSASAAKKTVENKLLLTTVAVLNGFVGRADVVE